MIQTLIKGILMLNYLVVKQQLYLLINTLKLEIYFKLLIKIH